MNHVILTISGINYQNFETVHDIVGHAGYAGCLKLVDECTRTLDIGSDDHRKQCGIADEEIKTMVGELILNTSCTVESRLFSKFTRETVKMTSDEETTTLRYFEDGVIYVVDILHPVAEYSCWTNNVSGRSSVHDQMMEVYGFDIKNGFEE